MMIVVITVGIMITMTLFLVFVFIEDMRKIKKGEDGKILERNRYTVMIRNGKTYNVLASGLTEEQAEERKRELEKVYDVKVVEE